MSFQLVDVNTGVELTPHQVCNQGGTWTHVSRKLLAKVSLLLLTSFAFVITFATIHSLYYISGRPEQSWKQPTAVTSLGKLSSQFCLTLTLIYFLHHRLLSGCTIRKLARRSCLWPNPTARICTSLSWTQQRGNQSLTPSPGPTPSTSSLGTLPWRTPSCGMWWVSVQTRWQWGLNTDVTSAQPVRRWYCDLKLSCNLSKGGCCPEVCGWGGPSYHSAQDSLCTQTRDTGNTHVFLIFTAWWWKIKQHTVALTPALFKISSCLYSIYSGNQRRSLPQWFPIPSLHSSCLPSCFCSSW